MSDEKYTMAIGLNVLNHLGINLYSNIPAVLSEVVANAWDADADIVDIKIEKETITITDTGHGMTLLDINNKYLYVGYQRRTKPQEAVTDKYHRSVMGRKGIGKLSLFSIAETIEIQTMKDGERNGLVMSAKKLKEVLEKGDNTTIYHPEPIPDGNLVIDKQGTIVTLRDLKKNTATTSAALKKRLARRFSVIGPEYDFNVIMNGQPIAIIDRDYFYKIQHIWLYGEGSMKYKECCRPQTLKSYEPRAYAIPGTGYQVSGWIGTVEMSGLLQDGEDNLNKIVIIVRGKLAQEDILEDFPEGGLYTKYIIGEITANFLDEDDKEDSATTNRQEIKKDDQRYIALRGWVQAELKYIQSKWTDLRNEEGKDRALLIPAIKEWFDTLGPDQKKHAESLFGKINRIHFNNDEERKSLFKYAVLAFESYRYKQNLQALESLTPEDIGVIAKIFADHDDIEATLYHQITRGRLKVIETLQAHVRDEALEKIIQKHIFEHLWLLDPSWDRATEAPLMEQQMKTAFAGVDACLTLEELEGRFDIRYKQTSGKHIIIELKKADRILSYIAIMGQLDKYRTALLKLLEAAGKANEPIESVCLVGKPLKEWTSPKRIEETIQSMAPQGMRVVLYQQLIEDSYRSYQTYLDTRQETNRVSKLIQSIEDAEM
jgi:hypothetical protein